MVATNRKPSTISRNGRAAPVRRKRDEKQGRYLKREKTEKSWWLVEGRRTRTTRKRKERKREEGKRWWLACCCRNLAGRWRGKVRICCYAETACIWRAAVSVSAATSRSVNLSVTRITWSRRNRRQLPARWQCVPVAWPLSAWPWFYRGCWSVVKHASVNRPSWGKGGVERGVLTSGETEVVTRNRRLEEETVLEDNCSTPSGCRKSEWRSLWWMRENGHEEDREWILKIRSMRLTVSSRRHDTRQPIRVPKW